MCDYSLLGHPNRLAVEGEDLVVHRFPENVLGLVSPSAADGDIPNTDNRFSKLWSALKSVFSFQPTDFSIAVCVPPEARLLLRDIPAHLKYHLKIGSTEEVVFTQLSAAEYAFRDAVRFKNGREILLQRLIVGQRVQVLRLNSPLDEPEYRGSQPDMAGVAFAPVPVHFIGG